MSLEELLKSKIIRKIKPNHNLALNAIKRAKRDIDTAKTLITNKKLDWSLAVSYNAMLAAGRALMLKKGYRPSSTQGHVAVVKFLHTTLKTQQSNQMTMIMNGMRKKRHRIIYEEMDIVTQEEAKQALTWAQEIIKSAENTIHQTKTT